MRIFPHIQLLTILQQRRYNNVFFMLYFKITPVPDPPFTVRDITVGPTFQMSNKSEMSHICNNKKRSCHLVHQQVSNELEQVFNPTVGSLDMNGNIQMNTGTINVKISSLITR